MSSSAKLTGRVLVLGEDTRSFLTVIRSLGRAGLEVHVAWCPPDSSSLQSRYVSKVHWIRGYQHGDPACLAEFLELLRRESFDLVIPCQDSAILPLQRWRNQIEPVAPIYLLPERALEIAFSKQKTYELAEELGICLPRQRVVHSSAEVQAAADEFGFPLVLKPQASVELRNVSSRNKVIKLWKQSDLAHAETVVAEKGCVLIQEHFSGVGLGVEVLCRAGEILTAFQHERIHEPLFGGGSSYRKSVPLHQALLESTARLMKALDYTGVAMVEFKMNPNSGKWILVEINGRFWGSLPLSVAAGIDFPRYLYEMLRLGRTSFPRSYNTNHYARNWVLDLYWLRENLASDRSDPTLMTVPLPVVAKEAQNVILLRESSDTLTWDDPRPALAEAAQLVRSRLLPRAYRLGAVRKRMERRARRSAIRAKQILFVCKGNICRSPFAEAALRKLAPRGIEIRSAGYYPAGDRPSPQDAIAAASAFGIDLSQHRSRVLDEEAMQWADAIFFFDLENQEALRCRFPAALSKMHFLGALDAGRNLEIADPFEEGLDQFRETYRQIFELLDRVAGSLRCTTGVTVLATPKQDHVAG